MISGRLPICILILLFCSLLTAHAQTDKWVGTWSMEYKPYPTTTGIKLLLHIGEPAYNTLYPAQIQVLYSPFAGTYEVLLAKKNDTQLGIGRGKYPVSETPFHLGAWMLYLNGTLNYQAKANPELTVERMWINSYELFMQGLYADDEMYAYMKDILRDLLSRKDIVLKKLNNTPWKHKDAHRILHPEGDSVYLGMYDKIDVYDSIVPLSLRDEDTTDKDTVTLLHNGKQLLDRAFISTTGKVLQLKLDTGINIITLFADNYGRLPPNTGAFRVKTSTGEYAFDFTHRPNIYATFLVAQLNRVPRKPVNDSAALKIQLARAAGNNNTQLPEIKTGVQCPVDNPVNNSSGKESGDVPPDTNTGSNTDINTRKGINITGDNRTVFTDTTSRNTEIEYINGRAVARPARDTIIALHLRKVNDKRVTERRTSVLEKITVAKADILLELWDDATEDGDSISIRLNGQEVVTGLPVKRKRQLIKVTLEPGENRLVMVADNLGSIPPNTAVMRVVSGELKRYLSIKTDSKRNNMLVITYKPGPVSSRKR